MRYFLLPLLFAASPAAAHIGHVGEVMGHGHWLGVAAGLTAIAIAVITGLKTRGEAAAEDDGEETGDEEPQEA